MAKLSHQTLILATVISTMALLSEPCNSIAIPVRTRSRLQGANRNQEEARSHHANSQEIQVFVPGGAPQGSIHGPMLQDSSDHQPPVTAFSAHRYNGLSVTTGVTNITYDKEEIDLTNTFEHTKGYFQCQVPGLYYFSFSFWARTSTPLKIGLQHNGQTKAALFVGRGSLLEQASQNTILLLKERDRVWLEAYAPSIITPSTSPINIFNGYLINTIK
ncbi:complement C1q subcomponent subunit A-like [Amphiura filiformis]|uniref:complement C1q subcomponent subunit A-like n=1 Tax=Amphiura filiformis TaxID=82378 RepID=UPI003B20C247